jgi:hypothetical protein
MIFPPGQCTEYLQAGQQASPTAKKKKKGSKREYFVYCYQRDEKLSPLQGMSRHFLRRAVTEEK